MIQRRINKIALFEINLKHFYNRNMLPIYSYKSILAMRDIAPVIWDTDIKVFALGKLLGLGRWEVGGGLYMGY